MPPTPVYSAALTRFGPRPKLSSEILRFRFNNLRNLLQTRLLLSACQGVVFAPAASRTFVRLFSFAKEFSIMSTVRPPAGNPSNGSSTGPRTPAGKAISSQNARKHDLCSKTLRLSPEE